MIFLSYQSKLKISLNRDAMRGKNQFLETPFKL